MKHLLEISNVHKKYQDGSGIHNISFSIDPGEIYGVLGGNRSGKTTFMRIAAGDLQPDCGHILFEGCNLKDKIPQEVKSLFYPPVLHGKLTARENLRLACEYNTEENKCDVDYLLNLTRLIDYRIESVNQYTESMKLRLRLALILLTSPKLIILDEPDLKMDAEGLYLLRIILLQQIQKGTSFLISSKNISQMELMCNKVAILNNGKLISKYPMKKILFKYSSLENYYLNTQNKF